MRKPRASCLLLPVLATIALTGACAHNTFSPPSSTLPMDSSRTIGKDRTAVSGGLSAVSAMFGPNVHARYLEMTEGVSDRTDISVRATRAEMQEESTAGTDRVAIAGRLGFKHTPGAQRGFAFIGGVGGGRSAGGRFIAADFGFSASYHNCYFIPTFSARAFASEPIDPRRVDTSTGSDAPGTEVDTPKRTHGFDAGVALELPIGECGTDAPFAIRASVGVLNLYDGETQEEMMQGAVGAVIRF